MYISYIFWYLNELYVLFNDLELGLNAYIHIYKLYLYYNE